jgi:hypothetical protein
MSSRTTSPYLDDPARLADVVAAIQAMGTYKFYKLSFEAWADRIVGDKSKADYWRAVFEAHPEFFRLDSPRENASLVWRRQYPKRYYVDEDRKITQAEYYGFTQDQKKRVSRNPLAPPDIKALIDTAIDMHSRALEDRKEKRWWLPLAAVFGGLVGSVLGVLLPKLFTTH